LPPGLAMNPSSVMTGTPTIAGTTIFTVKVVDSSAGTITKELTLTVIPASAPVTITSLSPLPAGTVGTVYSTTLVALGGTPGLSWTVSSGALPAGRSISGARTTTGTATFTIRVQDSGSPQQFDQKLSLLRSTPNRGRWQRRQRWRVDLDECTVKCRRQICTWCAAERQCGRRASCMV
jgi:hypothetical protein